jgi:hypothetical protein
MKKYWLLLITIGIITLIGCKKDDEVIFNVQTLIPSEVSIHDPWIYFSTDGTCFFAHKLIPGTDQVIFNDDMAKDIIGKPVRIDLNYTSPELPFSEPCLLLGGDAINVNVEHDNSINWNLTIDTVHPAIALIITTDYLPEFEVTNNIIRLECLESKYTFVSQIDPGIDTVYVWPQDSELYLGKNCLLELSYTVKVNGVPAYPNCIPQNGYYIITQKKNEYTFTIE